MTKIEYEKLDTSFLNKHHSCKIQSLMPLSKPNIVLKNKIEAK